MDDPYSSLDLDLENSVHMHSHKACLLLSQYPIGDVMLDKYHYQHDPTQNCPQTLKNEPVLLDLVKIFLLTQDCCSIKNDGNSQLLDSKKNV